MTYYILTIIGLIAIGVCAIIEIVQIKEEISELRQKKLE